MCPLKVQLDGNSRWAGYEGKGSVKDNVVVLTYSLSLMEGGGIKHVKWFKPVIENTFKKVNIFLCPLPTFCQRVLFH